MGVRYRPLRESRTQGCGLPAIPCGPRTRPELGAGRRCRLCRQLVNISAGSTGGSPSPVSSFLTSSSCPSTKRSVSDAQGRDRSSRVPGRRVSRLSSQKSVRRSSIPRQPSNSKSPRESRVESAPRWESTSFTTLVTLVPCQAHGGPAPSGVRATAIGRNKPPAPE